MIKLPTKRLSPEAEEQRKKDYEKFSVEYKRQEKNFKKQHEADKQEIKQCKAQLELEKQEKEQYKEELAQQERNHKKELVLQKINYEQTIKQNQKAFKEKEKQYKNTIDKQNKEILKLNQRIAKLEAELNQDSSNSSRSSSSDPDYKKPKRPNNRDKSGKKPGGQKGHKGHGPEKRPPNKVVPLYIEEYENNDEWERIEEPDTKQLTDVHVTVLTIEYRAFKYRNKKTGKIVRADFPEGLVNEVTYGPESKGLVLTLSLDGRLPMKMISDMLLEITNGEFTYSPGTISNIIRQFADCTEKERLEAIKELRKSDILHIDSTGARINGTCGCITVCADKDGKYVQYVGTAHKGHEGAKATSIGDGMFTGTLVHDGESTFYNYAEQHQECLAHIMRDLRGVDENDKGVEWAGRMRKMLSELMHNRYIIYENHQNGGDWLNKISDSYDALLKLSKKEYANHPVYYNGKGHKLARRLERNKEHILHFLTDPEVPYDNNLAERSLRDPKVKLKVSQQFRSKEGLAAYCNGKTVLSSPAVLGDSTKYDFAVDVFSRATNVARMDFNHRGSE